MSLLAWIGFILACAVAYAGVTWVYRRRETPGRGRTLLAGLRFATLALLLLLLFDPRLPAGTRGSGGPAVLIDNSLSMALPSGKGQTRWEQAVSEARSEGARDIILFGDAPHAIPVDSLAAARPAAARSELLPALQAAAESGAQKVVVLTDGGIDDADEVARWLPRLGVEVEMRRVADPASAQQNRALSEIESPAWAEAGKPFEVRVGVTSNVANEPVIVVLRQNGRVVANAPLTTAAAGRVAAGVLRFTPEPVKGGGVVRYDVAIEPADSVHADDERSFYVNVSDKPAGAVLLSFRPDWEPRFLTPVLEQALGLPARAYLWTQQSGRFYTVGSAAAAAREAPEAEIRAQLQQATLVVLHGIGPAAPAWAKQLTAASPHVLAFPAAEASELAGIPVPLPPNAPGDWYPNPDVPPSPIAPLLASAAIGALPPLTSLRPLAPPRGTWAPLLAANGRRGGGTTPILLGGQDGNRRWALALGEGYWQWAFRADSSRDAYRRLWAAVAGWLVQDDRSIAAAVRPVQRAVARGEAVRWVTASAVDSMRLQITDAQGARVQDTVLTAVQADSLASAPLQPGHYTYSAVGYSAGGTTSATGPLTVQTYSPDYARALLSLADLKGREQSLRESIAGIGGHPLHATWWPYVLLILLLCTEWTLRRRWGLR